MRGTEEIAERIQGGDGCAEEEVRGGGAEAINPRGAISLSSMSASGTKQRGGRGEAEGAERVQVHQPTPSPAIVGGTEEASAVQVSRGSQQDGEGEGGAEGGGGQDEGEDGANEGGDRQGRRRGSGVHRRLLRGRRVVYVP